MPTQEELVGQKLAHAKKILAKLDEQRKLLAHFEKHPSAQMQATDMRQSVRISMHHLEDAILDVQKHTGGFYDTAIHGK